MKNTLIKFALFFASASLTACSSTSPSFNVNTLNPFNHTVSKTHTKSTATTTTHEESGADIGGAIGRSMDEVDRSKMTHALDKAPGKSTEWVNEISETAYTVVPTKKVTINGNPYCRQYHITAVMKNQQELSHDGTACISQSGVWQAASGG